MSELSEGLGKPATLVFDGREYQIEPLDLNDLADLEAEIGDLEFLDVSRIHHQRLVLWLTFRRIDPELSPEDKDEMRYKMTLVQAGRMMNLKKMQTGEGRAFIEDVLKLSGVLPEATEPARASATETDAGNAEASEPKRRKSASGA